MLPAPVGITPFLKFKKNVAKYGKNILKTQKKCDITHGI
jgi:hypothetical protein